MTNKFLFLAFACFLQLSTACSVSTSVGGKDVAKADVAGGGQSESYKYDFTCNGCKTGEQVFDSRSGLCTALLDESRNNGCCRREREDQYQNQCN